MMLYVLLNIKFRELVASIKALGQGAWLCAKDIEDGYYNVSVRKQDVWFLGFYFEGQIYVFQRIPMGLSSSPGIFMRFMHFTLWAIKNNKPSLYYKQVFDINNKKHLQYYYNNHNNVNVNNIIPREWDHSAFTHNPILKQLYQNHNNNNNIHYTKQPHLPLLNIDPYESDYIDNNDCNLVDINNFSDTSDIHYFEHYVFIPKILYYVDDIFGGAKSKTDAFQQWSHSDIILETLNLPQTYAKGRKPDQFQKLLGKMFDTKLQWCKLPMEIK